MLLAERRAATGVRTLVVRVRHTVARSILEIRGDPMAPTTRMGRVTAAACIAVMGAAGLSACTASGATDGGRTGEEEATALPPGVLPPNDPPQPGDARLGPDGHYDYSAPDFVLKNPCDTEAYEVALRNGWTQPSFGTVRRDEPAEKTCSIIKDSTGIVLFSFSKNPAEFLVEGSQVSYEESRGIGIAVIKAPNLFGESCFTGVETPNGLVGALTGVGGFSNHQTIESACAETKHIYHELFGGIHAV
nr:hypothetical protein [Corynebacterium xerosis]